MQSKLEEAQKYVRHRMDGFLGSDQPLNLGNILALLGIVGSNENLFYVSRGFFCCMEDEDFQWKLSKPLYHGHGDMPVILMTEQRELTQLAIAKLLGWKGGSDE